MNFGLGLNQLECGNFMTMYIWGVYNIWDVYLWGGMDIRKTRLTRVIIQYA